MKAEEIPRTRGKTLRRPLRVRCRAVNQKGILFFVTGLSGSGKTSLLDLISNVDLRHREEFYSGEIEDLTNKIDYLLQNPSKMKYMGDNSLMLIRKKYNMNNMINVFEKAITAGLNGFKNQ